MKRNGEDAPTHPAKSDQVTPAQPPHPRKAQQLDIEAPLFPSSWREGLWHRLLGRPRDPMDPELGHKLSLAAFLAWVGLGMDGLSSSAYGPPEAFLALGQHTYLAVFLAVATAITVLILSFTYSKIIEHFPMGGGGYIVATHLLGRPAGVVSGCALLVDYVLTITTSIASGGDALFSLLPPLLRPYKLAVEFGAILILILLNLRGVKESVTALVPFFLIFVVTHLALIGGGILSHLGNFGAVLTGGHAQMTHDVSTLGGWALFVLFLRAYSMGGGTYTGIEAVSNAAGALREPRIATGKRTMAYLAGSLAFTAGGLLLCYMLAGVQFAEGKTLNAVLAEGLMGHWEIAGFPVGSWAVYLTILSEAVLLLIAAQTGFIDGPRVMANMARDSWLPRRFASLSDRLTMQNGVLLIGAAAILLLSYTRGQIGLLLVMYSINVFITFSLSQLAMLRFWWRGRASSRGWQRNLVIHLIGLALCFAILLVMVVEKFLEGAWVTLLLTGTGVSVCFFIRNHYRRVGKWIALTERSLLQSSRSLVVEGAERDSEFDIHKPTLAILVGGFGHLGKHCLLTTLKFFPHTFHNVIFLTVGVLNSDFFTSGADIRELERRTQTSLDSYMDFARKLGFPSKALFRLGADVVAEASQLCLKTAEEHPGVVFFAGELLIPKSNWIQRVLHNETAYAIQRQIRFAGLPMVIMPIVLT